MDRAPTLDESRVILAAGRILEAVADGQVFVGTLDRVARQLGVSPQEARAALRELRQVGWVAVQTLPGMHLSVRAERRAFGRQRIITGERRQPDQDAWPL
jgi:hypothetical protein